MTALLCHRTARAAGAPLKSCLSDTSLVWIRSLRRLLLLMTVPLIVAGCDGSSHPNAAAPALSTVVQPRIALTPIDSQLALKHHLERPNGLLFIGEPWSIRSETVRKRLEALVDNSSVRWPADLSLAQVQLKVPGEPSWLFEFLTEHRVLAVDGSSLLDYAKGDGALLWSKRGRVVDVAPRPAELTDASIMDRTRR